MLTVQQAFDLALQHHQAGRLAEAEALYRQILGVQPRHAGALRSLGVIAQQAGRHDLAVEWIRQSISLDSSSPMAFCNLSAALLGQCHFEEAIAAARRALELKPDCAEAHVNLGTALVELGQFDEATVSFCRAIDLKPNDANARFNYSMLLLSQGDFERGWPMYEARRKVFRTAEREFVQPLWDGGPIDQRRVLIQAEQGFGDSIQFIRYAEFIADRGGAVLVACQRPLVELLRTAKGVAAVFAASDPLPQFDLYVPMASQPLAFRSTRQTIPRHVPYLFAEQTRRDAWRDRLGRNPLPLRVGLAWAGNRSTFSLQKRDVALETLLPILQVAGIDFFSLQIGRGAEEMPGLPAGAARMVDHTKHIQDFADTAAFMAELDLIISIDTAAAHLAGALGRPVWTLLAFVPDWRWGLDQEETLWYPTMRLFRQPARGDWVPVIQRVADELRRWVTDGGGRAMQMRSES